MRNNPKHLFRHALFLLVLAVATTGCTPALYWKSPTEMKAETEYPDELQDMGYMARYILDRDDRQKLEQIVWKTEVKKQKKNTGDLSTEAGLIGTSMLGNNPLSHQGVGTAGTISLGVDAIMLGASMLEWDGNYDAISKIYLPSSFHGKKIDSREKAYRTARRYTEKRIKLFAKDMGRTIECLYGCETVIEPTETLFKLTRKGFVGNEPYDHKSDAYSEEEYYNPPALFVLLRSVRMMPAKTDPVRARILGFTPAWESRYENGWQLYLFGEPRYTENGEIEFVEDKTFGKRLKYKRYTQIRTPLGRHFYRTVTGGDNLNYVGYDFFPKEFFAMKGNFYRFITRNPFHFMAYKADPKIDEEPLAWTKKGRKSKTVSTNHI